MKRIILIFTSILFFALSMPMYAEETKTCPAKCDGHCWDQCKEDADCGTDHYCSATDCGTRCYSKDTVITPSAE